MTKTGSRKHWSWRAAAAAAGALTLAGVAHADPYILEPDGSAMDIRAEIGRIVSGVFQPDADGVITPLDGSANGVKLRVVDHRTNPPTTLVAPSVVNAGDVWEPTCVTCTPIPSVAPTITLQQRTDGFDIIYSYNNTTGAVRTLGELWVTDIKMPCQSNFRHFGFGGRRVTAPQTPPASCNNIQFYAPGVDGSYPNSWYAPVQVVDFDTTPESAGGVYTLGISLIYPVMQYKHSVYAYNFQSWGSWWSGFVLNRTDSTYNPDGNLQPGETRTYRMTFRVQKSGASDHANQWMRTLEPYREYFRNAFGGVQYTRNTKPVSALYMSSVTCSAGNPFGFNNPKLNEAGWEPWVSKAITRDNLGWTRFMYWVPSGRRCDGLDFPFNFTTHWADPGMEAADNTLHILANYGADPDTEVGLWWGNAPNVTTDWNDPTPELFDPSNLSHRTEAYEELNGAVNVNATMIGLDAFAGLGVWRGYQWLDDMTYDQSTPPVKRNVRFLTELGGCDIYHLRAGQHVTLQSMGNPWFVTPYYIADYLVPGHETWRSLVDSTGISILLCSQAPAMCPGGTPINATHWQNAIELSAQQGYIPVVNDGSPVTSALGSFDAVKSWNPPTPLVSTVPKELIICEQADCPLDLNCDRLIDVDDLFLAFDMILFWPDVYEYPPPQADIDRNLVINFDDYYAYQDAWLAAVGNGQHCP